MVRNTNLLKIYIMKNEEAFTKMLEITIQNKEDIDEHLLTLFSLVVSMKPKHIIELGVRSARSTYAFLFGCHVIGTKLTSVDKDAPLPSLHLPDEWKTNWNCIKSDSLNFLENEFPAIWEERRRTGGIIYIDDWHDGDHVSRELSVISDHVGPKDLILLHDLMYGNSQPHYRSVDSPEDKQWDKGGPYKAVSNLDLEVWEYATIPRCHGMTILRKRSEKIISV